MTEDGIDGEARVSRGELVPVEPPESLQDWAELLVARAREAGVALRGEGGLLTGLMRHQAHSQQTLRDRGCDTRGGEYVPVDLGDSMAAEIVSGG